MKSDGASISELSAAKLKLVKDLHALAKKDAANHKAILALKTEQKRIIHELLEAKKSGSSSDGEIEALQDKEKSLNKELGTDSSALSTQGGLINTDQSNIK